MHWVIFAIAISSVIIGVALVKKGGAALILAGLGMSFVVVGSMVEDGRTAMLIWIGALLSVGGAIVQVRRVMRGGGGGIKPGAG